VGDVDVDALEVVGAGSADGDLIIHAKLLFSRILQRSANLIEEEMGSRAFKLMKGGSGVILER
jgi:hypothetical protein